MFFTTLIWLRNVYKISSCCSFCIHFWFKWELWKTFDTKMIGWTHFTPIEIFLCCLLTFRKAKLRHLTGQRLCNVRTQQFFLRGQSFFCIMRRVWYHHIWIQNYFGFIVSDHVWCCWHLVKPFFLALHWTFSHQFSIVKRKTHLTSFLIQFWVKI